MLLTRKTWRMCCLCRDEVRAYVQECQEVYDYEDSRGGGLSIGMGPNNCPAVLLYHPTGYTAVVSQTS